jgi:hypothetical protein
MFQLAFHVPFFVLRLDSVSFPNNCDQFCLGSFGTGPETFAIYKAQLSLTVFGASDSTWTSYCLVRLIDDEADTLEEGANIDSGYDDDDTSSDEDSTHSSSWGAPVAEKIYTDPRKYWLECSQDRMRVILREWRELIFALDSQVQQASLQP